jgi:hypothetical protein
MRASTLRTARRGALLAAPLALALALTACGDDDNDDRTPTPSPTPTSTQPTPPSPTPPATGRNVTRCLNQTIPGTDGATPASLVVPDTVKLDFTKPNGFPNGRRFNDPVIDVTLAVILLDLTVHSPTTLIGLNPGNDNPPTLGAFPFMPQANGGQPGPGSGVLFNFRDNPPADYVRVDRMGQPAVATALIGAPFKNAYNDANPSDDAAGTFVPEITSRLTTLHNVLVDDLQDAGLTPCSTP